MKKKKKKVKTEPMEIGIAKSEFLSLLLYIKLLT